MRRRAWWGLAAVGLAAFLVFMVARWPAAHAWELARERMELPPGVEVGAVTGTVWRGAIHGLRVEGVAITKLDWELRPTSLLRGRLDGSCDASLADGHARGRFSVDRRGVTLLDADGRLAMSVLAEAAARIGGRSPDLEGTLLFAIPRARIDFAGSIETLEGRMAWHDAAVTVDRHARLGGFDARFEDDGEGGVVGTIEDTGGPLALSGDWRLGSDGRYGIDVVADTRAEAEPALGETLEMLGPRETDGFHIGLEGAL